MALCAALARTGRLEPRHSTTQMTTIPARTDRMLCAELVLVMSENAAPTNLGAGDEILRPLLLQAGKSDVVLY